MPADHVPSTTSIKRNRVANVDSDRLARRHQQLLGELMTGGASHLGTRHNFVMRAAEMSSVESELVARGLVNHTQLSNMREHARSMRVDR